MLLRLKAQTLCLVIFQMAVAWQSRDRERMGRNTVETTVKKQNEFEVFGKFKLNNLAVCGILV